MGSLKDGNLPATFPVSTQVSGYFLRLPRAQFASAEDVLLTKAHRCHESSLPRASFNTSTITIMCFTEENSREDIRERGNARNSAVFGEAGEKSRLWAQILNYRRL
ncbi:hypothetical protein Y032_0013g2071 [Ancylostoma ceylanicum]|uniref:Uncharacterized protein n=1 Tax=Ancylostoma ceylanicum TaxID=53326 RepID=A0A016VCF0_9BILA|nr:hypothetical protein Y032_0013g2071 [Ancylostoma ceylanicum]